MGGAVYVGDSAIPGALAAIGQLHAANLNVRHITNATTKSRHALIARLADLGLSVRAEDVFVPAASVRGKQPRRSRRLDHR